jgi:hypothetical protein
MKVQRRFIATALCAVALLMNGMGVAGQERRPGPPSEPRVAFAEGFGAGFQYSFQGDDVNFVRSEMGFGGKVVKGAPYSAQAVTESVQMLADGNRIVRKNTASVYRDSEGRTRNEQTLRAVGPYAVAGEPPQTIFIHDPVAEVSYVLDPRDRIARKMFYKIAMTVSPSGENVMKKRRPEQEPAVVGPEDLQKIEAKKRQAAANKSEDMARAEIEVAVATGSGGGVFVAAGGGGPRKGGREPKVESLGKQMIEGVEAEGTRHTITIAAGEIGNELAINIVSERWYSPELQLVVMTKHSDPRFGENSYRLTGINRAEPSRSLFEVPSDYTVKETMPGPMRRKMEIEKMEKERQQ